MKAAVLKQLFAPLVVEQVPVPVSSPGFGQVKVLAAGLNRRDYYITLGQYAKIILPAILGSDGCGRYEDEEVIIQPGYFWGANPAYQDSKYQILGMPSQGTLAEYVNVPLDHIYPKPAHLSVEEAAAIPLAGLTAFRAVVTKAQVVAGEQVLITGIGGGVALLAMQFCLALDAAVYVTSSDQTKIERAMAMGCRGGILYTDKDWGSNLYRQSGGMDKVIDGSGGQGFNQVIDTLRPGGHITVYGGSAGKIEVSPQKLFWKQITISGTTMGTPDEFKRMLEFISDHNILPVVDKVYDLEDINSALERLKDQHQFGKIIIQIKPKA